MSLRAETIDFAYGPGRPVLRAVTAALDVGRVTAILGPNGAGKSTLLRVLMGLVSPGRGRAVLDGADVRTLTRAERARRLVYVPQQTSLAFAFSVRAVVAMGLYISGEPGDARRADAAMERLGIIDLADRPFGLLSAGQQQRVTLARALAQAGLPAPGGSRAFLADEPVAAMDPRHALECLGLLRTLAGEGSAVAVVLHDLSAALRYADDALVLDSAGTVAASGPVQGTVTAGVLGPVYGVPFREVYEAGRRIGLIAGDTIETERAAR